ncbi:Crp/Fnr family transcriptional regulator [Amycolatopsis sp. NPDC003861]
MTPASRDQARLQAMAERRFGTLAALALKGRFVRFSANARVIVQQNPTPPVYFLLSGIAKLQRAAPEGTDARAMIVDVAGPGDLLGAEAALLRGTGHLTCVATKDIQALEVAQNTFLTVLEEDPVAMRRITELLAVSVITRDGSLAYALSDVEIRLAAFLARMYRKFRELGGRDSASQIDIGFTRLDIADAIGASEGAVDRALRALKDGNIITTGYKRIGIIDPDALLARLGYADLTRRMKEVHPTATL